MSLNMGPDIRGRPTVSEEEIIRRLRGDLLDSYDEELEMELEDRNIDAVSGVKLTFTKNRLEILATAPEIGEARETMDVKYKGPDIAISFNPAFLMDPLKALTSDEVFLDLTDDTSPGVMRSTISFVYVLMPIRVS